MTAHLKVSDLKFCVPEAGKHWQELKDGFVEFGRVCSFVADRYDPWNLFVIIEEIPQKDHDGSKLAFDNTSTLKIIFPRLQVHYGEYLLGQDKLVLKSELQVTHLKDCQLKNIRQGCDFTCTCDAEIAAIKAYNETFTQQPDNEGDYIIHTLNLNKLTHMIYLECVKDDMDLINYLDQPLDMKYLDQC